jgi:hypothetical protein
MDPDTINDIYQHLSELAAERMATTGQPGTETVLICDDMGQ